MGELHTHFAVILARRSRPSRCHLLGTLTCLESAIRTVTQLTFTPVSKETQAAVAAAFPRSSPPAAGLPPLQTVPSPCTAYIGLFGGAPGILQVRPTFRALCLRPPTPTSPAAGEAWPTYPILSGAGRGQAVPLPLQGQPAAHLEEAGARDRTPKPTYAVSEFEWEVALFFI